MSAFGNTFGNSINLTPQAMSTGAMASPVEYEQLYADPNMPLAQGPLAFLGTQGNLYKSPITTPGTFATNEAGEQTYMPPSMPTVNPQDYWGKVVEIGGTPYTYGTHGWTDLTTSGWSDPNYSGSTGLQVADQLAQPGGEQPRQPGVSLRPTEVHSRQGRGTLVASIPRTPVLIRRAFPW